MGPPRGQGRDRDESGAGSAMGAKLQLLCAAAALICATAPPGQPGGRAAAVAAALPAGEGDGYGVKLCGREFIRAVIFTCGGSRWKRLSLLAMEPAPAAGECPGDGRGAPERAALSRAALGRRRCPADPGGGGDSPGASPRSGEVP